MALDRLHQRGMAARHAAGSRALRSARAVLHQLFGPPQARTFAVRLWDGSCEYPDGAPLFTLVLRHQGALRRMLWLPTERRLAEAYVRNDVDVEGDLEAAASLVEIISARMSRARTAIAVLLGLVPLLLQAPPVGGTQASRSPYTQFGFRHSRRRDAAAVRYHYDIGNNFYRLWLDEHMVYSCAYFPSGKEDLETAQRAKLDLVCRKLRLRRGERFLDIGCGWGALAMHAVQHYGVHATGVTLSRQQAELARSRIAAAHLGAQCRIEVCDYRDLPPEPFDKIASVGMVEHVGGPMLPAYFRQAFCRLVPGGLFLNHGIVSSAYGMSVMRRWMARRLRRWTSFVEAYVFPDGELVEPAEMLAPATQAGFELRDVESLREHYARTLRLWVGRLEARQREAVALVGDSTYRLWRAHMAACARAFSLGQISVVQMLFAKPDADGRVNMPATRRDMYI